MTASRIKLTAPRVEALTCPEGKAQLLTWDTDTPGLQVRTTPRRKTYCFESRLAGKTIRMTIGDCKVWALGDARAEARRLQTIIDGGTDPRQQKAEAIAQAERKRQQEKVRGVTLTEAWGMYIEARTPFWGERHRDAHITMERIELAPLMPQELARISRDDVVACLEANTQARPGRVAQARALLRTFFNWAASHAELGEVVTANPAAGKRTAEAAPKPTAKQTALLREQLPAFFAGARAIQNPVVGAYLQSALLLGTRPGTGSTKKGELLHLKWGDIDFEWKAIKIRDKVASKGGKDGVRIIPLPAYVESLLIRLPRRGPYVFQSPTTDKPITNASVALRDLCIAAGLPHLTPHDLRRSFGSLSEWLELPAGVVRQIQGHAAGDVAERHYRVRPLDLLRLHHERFEAWILEQAQVEFTPAEQPAPALRLVS